MSAAVAEAEEVPARAGAPRRRAAVRQAQARPRRLKAHVPRARPACSWVATEAPLRVPGREPELVEQRALAVAERQEPLIADPPVSPGRNRRLSQRRSRTTPAFAR